MEYGGSNYILLVKSEMNWSELMQLNTHLFAFIKLGEIVSTKSCYMI